MRAATLSWLAAAILSAHLPACNEPEPQGKAERAAVIAKQLEASPDDAESVLEEHGLSIEQFEALMYEIAADPELSEEYEHVREE